MVLLSIRRERVGKLKPGGNYVDPEPFIAHSRGSLGSESTSLGAVAQSVRFDSRVNPDKYVQPCAKTINRSENVGPWDSSSDPIHHLFEFTYPPTSSSPFSQIRNCFLFFFLLFTSTSVSCFTHYVLVRGKKKDIDIKYSMTRLKGPFWEIFHRVED